MNAPLQSKIQDLMSVFTDTHCHIHDPEFFPDGGEAEYVASLDAGVKRMICVGTDVRSSLAAVEFASNHEGCFAATGVHPHDALKEGKRLDEIKELIERDGLKSIVAIGEIGLDYHYMNSPREIQIDILERQIDLALKFKLPISFHVREAYDDFWSILDNFSGVEGVLHSFTDNRENMERGLERGLLVGINGIVTFSQEIAQLVKTVPFDKIILETDAPYLTPSPLRGKINAPGNVRVIASYVAALRGITVEELSQRTEDSVSRLFF